MPFPQLPWIAMAIKLQTVDVSVLFMPYLQDTVWDKKITKRFRSQTATQFVLCFL